jgi:protoheme IX farnesyltransferase
MQVTHRTATDVLPGRLAAYLELVKIRLTTLVVMTTAVGFIVASDRVDWGRFLLTLIGTAMTAAGSMAANQAWERARDARMERTRERPIPTGQIRLARAVKISILLIASGVTGLAILVNPLTAALSLTVVGIYIFAYTPLKPIHPLCTLIGAICGAIPPMMGWTAATGGVAYGAWVLGAILFVWQIPHFLSLAWLYRDDYERAGFRMLPVLDRSGNFTSQVALVYITALVPIGLAMSLAGLAGKVFLVGSFLLGLGLLAQGVRLHLRRTDANARLLFLASLVYLTVFLILLVGNRGSIEPR